MAYFSRSDVNASNREARCSAATVNRRSRSNCAATDASETLADDLVFDSFQERNRARSVAIAHIVQDSVVERDRDRRLHGCPSPLRNGLSEDDGSDFVPRNAARRGSMYFLKRGFWITTSTSCGFSSSVSARPGANCRRIGNAGPRIASDSARDTVACICLSTPTLRTMDIAADVS